MTLAFLALDVERRTIAFEQAATDRSISPVILEKDFWVCWLLGELFKLSDVAPYLVFKGGTSLSKVFGAIDRFSEDIDLSVSPSFVGADVGGLAASRSRTSRDAAMVEMQRLCVLKTRTVIVPTLEAAIQVVLGKPPLGNWLSYEEEDHAPSPIVLFQYPTTQAASFPYVRRDVKLEMGSLTDQQPVGRHSIRPWVAERFPALFEDWRCEVTALELGRSFWEKATILHAEHHRPSEQATPDRYSRHYSDVARLLVLPEAVGFQLDGALCTRVAEWKDQVFPRIWARYDLARRGTFRLVPPEYRKKALAEDYLLMRPMFLSEPPTFESVISHLEVAERAINDS